MRAGIARDGQPSATTAFVIPQIAQTTGGVVAQMQIILPRIRPFPRIGIGLRIALGDGSDNHLIRNNRTLAGRAAHKEGRKDA